MDTPDIDSVCKVAHDLQGRTDHFWNSELRQASRVIECDWCIFCGETRPGYKGPHEKTWKK